MNFWKLADSVTNAIKEQTSEFTNAVQNTDWSVEFLGLQKGLQDDTKELGQTAARLSKQISTKAVEVVHTIPVAIRQTAEASENFVENPGNGDSNGVENYERVNDGDAAEDSVKTASIGTSFVGLGQEIMKTGAKALIQVSSTLENAVGSSRSPLTHNSEMENDADFREQVASMQRDCSLYCQDPEDLNEFRDWGSNFEIRLYESQISRILAENTFMHELQARIVPVLVEREMFWKRYFYRLHKLEQKYFDRCSSKDCHLCCKDNSKIAEGRSMDQQDGITLTDLASHPHQDKRLLSEGNTKKENPFVAANDANISFHEDNSGKENSKTSELKFQVQHIESRCDDKITHQFPVNEQDSSHAVTSTVLSENSSDEASCEDSLIETGILEHEESNSDKKLREGDLEFAKESSKEVEDMATPSQQDDSDYDDWE